MQNHDNLSTRLLKNRLFPDILRYATAGMFLPILLGLFFGSVDSSNPFNLLVWLTWWPLISISFSG